MYMPMKITIYQEKLTRILKDLIGLLQGHLKSKYSEAPAFFCNRPSTEVIEHA